jgi:molybdopterin-guanine dinucleotide biosynthesis protein A
LPGRPCDGKIRIDAQIDGQIDAQMRLMQRLEPPLLGLILAGGNSSRMGQDKALLVHNGTPLLRHIYNCAAEICRTVYVITPRQHRYAPLLPPTCEFIVEVGQNQGPLRAFREAIVWLGEQSLEPKGLDHQQLANPLDPQRLAHDDAGWILLLSCDLPHLNPMVLQQWVQDFIGSAPLNSPRESCPPLAYIPRNPQGWWEPLCGFYSIQCRSSLDRFLGEGGRSFQQWLNSERVVALPLEDHQVLLNWNTLKEAVQGSSSPISSNLDSPPTEYQFKKLL